MEIYKFLFYRNVSIPMMDFNITTSCTLKCKDCGSLMPFYDNYHQWTSSLELFKNDLDKLLSCVDKIYVLKLIGGEPLIVNCLAEILEYAAKNKKIKFIEIVTNGTILFQPELLKVASKYRHKVFVLISNYSSNKELKCLKYDDIKLQLSLNKIKYLFPSQPWFERGDIYRRHRSAAANKRIFKRCWQKDCIALMDGKFHHCTRSIAIQRLTDYEFLKDEYLDIRLLSQKSLSKKIRTFFLKDYFSVCDFCIAPSSKRVPRAIQTTEILKIGKAGRK